MERDPPSSGLLSPRTAGFCTEGNNFPTSPVVLVLKYLLGRAYVFAPLKMRNHPYWKNFKTHSFFWKVLSLLSLTSARHQLAMKVGRMSHRHHEHGSHQWRGSCMHDIPREQYLYSRGLFSVFTGSLSSAPQAPHSKHSFDSCQE